MLGSCSQSIEQDVTLDQSDKSAVTPIDCEDLGITFKKQGDALVFESMDAFYDAVRKLEEASYEKPIDVRDEIPIPTRTVLLASRDFHSLYDEYDAAMKEAEQYYDIEGGYEAFKKKYSSLYFPEYGDDYSAYLPVSSVEIAKLVNTKGEVFIDGKRLNMKDINSYEQLVQLGVTPPAENIQTRAAYPLNSLPTTYSDNKKRKIWVNVKTRNGSTAAVLQEVVIEVCFRKKGFLKKWYNYSSRTSLGTTPTFHEESKEGRSSHDYLLARKYGQRLTGVMYVTFRGTGDTKHYFQIDI
jgi:hypothetical protein